MFCEPKSLAGAADSMVLVTGANNNTELTLWTTGQFQKLQVIRFDQAASPDQVFFDIGMYASPGLITLAGRNHGVLMFLHVEGAGDEVAQMTSLTSLPLSLPLLSTVVTQYSVTEPVPGDPHADEIKQEHEIELYVNTTKKVQKLKVKYGTCETNVLPSADATQAVSVPETAQSTPPPTETKQSDADFQLMQMLQKMPQPAPSPEQSAAEPRRQSPVVVPQSKEPELLKPAKQASSSVAKAAVQAPPGIISSAASNVPQNALSRETLASLTTQIAAQTQDLEAQTKALTQLIKTSKSQNAAIQQIQARQAQAQEQQATKMTSLQMSMEKQTLNIMQIKTNMPRSETQIVSQVEKMMNKNFASFLKAQEEARKSSAAAEKEKIGRLLQVISETMHKTIASKVTEVVSEQMRKTVLPEIKKTISENVNENLVKQTSSAMSKGFNALNTSVRAYIPKLLSSSDVTNALATAVAGAVKKPVQESFESALQASVIPSFEASTKEMFRQIEETFAKGAKEHMASTAQEISSAVSNPSSGEAADPSKIAALVADKLQESYRIQNEKIVELLRSSQQALLQQHVEQAQPTRVEKAPAGAETEAPPVAIPSIGMLPTPQAPPTLPASA